MIESRCARCGEDIFNVKTEYFYTHQYKDGIVLTFCTRCYYIALTNGEFD